MKKISSYVNKNYYTISLMFTFLILLSLIIIIPFSANIISLIYIKNLFSFACHQIPGRSFYINGKPMIICSRCFGIYTGITILLLLSLFLKSIHQYILKFNLKFILIFALPLLIDWIINFLLSINFSNIVHFLTGIIFSIIPAYFILNLNYND